MTLQLDNALVRIFESGAHARPGVAGAGFLVAPRTVCTCAHVVARAVGAGANGPAPQALIHLDFSQIAPGVGVTARVTGWRALAEDGSGDVAILTLDSDPPAAARPATLVDARDLWQHKFAVAGFPAGHDHAVTATGLIQGAHGPHLVQFERERVTGYRAKEGFSGSPVWDEKLEGVVGMVAEVDIKPKLKVGFMMPTRVLLEVHPDLARVVRRPRDADGDAVRSGIPPAPPHHLARSAAVGHVRDQLISTASGDSDDHVLGIFGMPGVGKSVIGATLTRDEAVRAAFPDGVFWISVGRNASLLPLQSELLAMLGETTSDVFGVADAAERLSRALAVGRTLVILDDVWTAEQARSFGVPGANAALLLTTRSRGILATLGAGELEVGALDPAKEAMPLLAAWAGVAVSALPPEAAEIARRCGYLPLALAMVGAIVRGKPARWATLRDRLAAADLEALARQFPEYAYPSVVAAIDASVEALPPDVGRRFLDLAVFPDDVAIPETALRTLWGADGLNRWDVQSTVDQFADASLAQVDDRGVRLHDLIADYVRTRVTPRALPALHGRLLAAYRAQCTDGWTTAPDDGYLPQYLAHHLLAAGRRGELHALLDEETLAGGNRWFEAREGIDDVSGYVSDVERVWRDAEAGFTDGTLDARAGIARQVRCALTRSSLHAVAEGIPQELLVAVARDGTWSVARSLSFARRMPGAAQRASAIGALLPLALPAERREVLPEARSALVAARYESKREHPAALAQVVSGVALFDEVEALRIMRWEMDATDRVDAEEACVTLAVVAAEAPNSIQRTLLAELAERLEEIAPDPERGPGTIALCLAVLPPASLGDRFGPLIEVSKAKAYQQRGHALTFSQWILAIAPHLAPGARDDALDDALETLDGAPGTWADAFPGYARRLGPRYVARLWNAAEQLRLDYSTVIARARLVPFFPGAQIAAEASAALAELARVREDTDVSSRDVLDVASCELARYASPSVRAGLAVLARQVSDAERRAVALASVAAASVGAERVAIAGEALDAVATIRTPHQRREAMAAIVSLLPRELLPSALRVGRQTHDSLDRLALLPAIVASAPMADRERIVSWVLRVAGEELEEWDAAQALLHLRPDLPSALSAGALETARQLQSPRYRAMALAAVAPVLDPADALDVLEEARAAARSGDTDRDRAHALAAVLEATPPAGRGAHVAETLAAAAAVPELERRAEIVASIAPSLPDEEREALLAETLASAGSTRRPEAVVQNLAPFLSLPLAREAAEMVQVMDDLVARDCAPVVAARLAELGEVAEALALAHPDARQSKHAIDGVLARVAPFAGVAETTRIVQEASALHPYARDGVLAVLAPRMAELGLEAEALAAADQMGLGVFLARALVGIAPHVAPRERPMLLRRAIEMLSTVNLRSVSLVTLRLLTFGIAQLPRDDAHALLGEWLHSHASRERAASFVAVNAMAPVLVALGGAGAAADAWDSMEMVSRWWP